jgi:hypothetical protein
VLGHVEGKVLAHDSKAVEADFALTFHVGVGVGECDNECL